MRIVELIMGPRLPFASQAADYPVFALEPQPDTEPNKNSERRLHVSGLGRAGLSLKGDRVEKTALLYRPK